MDSQERPPRQQPPTGFAPNRLQPQQQAPPPPHPHRPAHPQHPLPSFETTKSIDSRPPLLAYGSSEHRVQFSDVASDANLLHASTSALQPGFSGADFKRKRSLVRPDRERIDENHRLYNYRKHAAEYEAEGRGVAAVSRTGHTASAGLAHDGGYHSSSEAYSNSTNLRRGKSILAREEGMANETGLSMFKRGATLRRPNNKSAGGGGQAMPGGAYEKRKTSKPQKEPLGPWMLFCLAVTICCPSPLLKCFGLRTKDRQSAWREKIGLLCIIGLAMAFVGYLTFGFTESVCGTPALRYKHGSIEGGSMIFHGYDYDLNNFSHPAANGIEGGSNPLYTGYNTGGMDGSFLFQTVNEKCLDIITPAPGTGITAEGNKLGWYFPCNVFNQWGTSIANLTDYSEGTLCHTQADARNQFDTLKPLGQIYFEWSDLKNTSRNLGVFDGAVLDFNLLTWLDKSQVSYPALFDVLKSPNSSYQGTDITALMVSSGQRAIAECLIDTIRVGFIDSVTLGCVASDIVLYVSLVVIIGVVAIRFFMAVLFGWFLSWKIGRFPNETYEQRRARAAEIENWTDDIYRPAPARYRPNAKAQKRSMLPKTSRFTKGDLVKGGGGASPSGARGGDFKYGEYRKSSSMTPSLSGGRSMLGMGMRNSPPGSPGGPASRSSTSLSASGYGLDALTRSAGDGYMGACPFPLEDVVPQPPPDFQPFNYPLAHSILLVTAYSESVEGLRTTLDSLATTDYPNSHKVILVIADGMVKGSGNSLSTPEIVLGMMKELVVPSEDVESLSYVAIADGHKRHNMAKVYAGFYEYDNNTVEMSKQQRVPMMLVAKVGNPSEVNDAKPGNRGKRDSQIILMSFLQKVMFDERMTTLEYEFFNSLWRCTGVSPDRYETVLCVDADTKIFPDSISRMVACMVHDPEIMGLCGETKIANKSETWVTMIQVFEYYVSHHLTKAFESMFGGVTCLPGCFSMYRIKAPKGGDGYWVPVLANPDIVEHYSENVVDTLHKKNLLLLGEDRYLTTLMLRTFPRRKMMFCPQAVCKTVVPDTFSVLLSQRRRWINSTVHNLFELFVVPDLCGVFCFSMRFVIFMELAGTLVLPAAIAFTLYLIVVAIIPGTVKPVLSLILLAIILGIPGVLIVVTSRKVAYLGWMLIYLMSLPIWNFVLPFYAFLHMDDFSWGQTRKVVGDDGTAHTDKDGVFDSSHIVMKRWADFERDRRYKSGAQSRDSTYDIVHRAGSPQRSASNRYSLVSSADTYASLPGSGSGAGETFIRRGSPSEGGFNPTSRYPATLELPAPLATQRPSPTSSSSSIPHDPHTPPELPSKSYDANPQQAYEYPRYAEGYDSDELDREAILGDPRGVNSPPLDSASTFPSAREDIIYAEPAPMEPSTSRNPFTQQQQQQQQQQQRPARTASKPRGVSLVDAGPVAGAEGVRVVQRQRRASQQGAGGGGGGGGGSGSQSQGPGHRSRASLGFDAPTSPTSGSSSQRGSLPPGAAPPRHSMGGV